MFNELRNLVLDLPFRIIVSDNNININNYIDILLFDKDRIIIKTKNKLITIKGAELLITHLENNEIQIKGNIKSVDLGD